MWTLLLWINQKIIQLNKELKEISEQKKRRQETQNIHSASRHLPDHIKRDMGLPPYDSSNNHDS
ncbi:hypothetical protein OAH87_06140 [Marinomonas sp.]|nr:hypothetical protein [Marinomonas sp.]MDB4838031.1 hypothetical protein [Marinomonas sp.]